MKILFYYPDKERSISLSSLMIAFQQQGHQVHLLTHADKGPLHQDVELSGVKTFTCPAFAKNSFSFYLKHIRFLKRFVDQHGIELVYSHIQVANFISVFAAKFSKARFILCRHHSDCAYLDNNFKEKLFDKVINKLGKEFIVPSQKVLDQMIKVEGVRGKKIHLIHYAYDFSKYPTPDTTAVRNIRSEYPTRLLLVKIARLIPEKRHLLLFEIINKLHKQGSDIKLLVLSDGVCRMELENYIRNHDLQKVIYMLGYRTDVMNYIGASDVVVHVSESEASNSLVKEAGLLKKPVILCRDVGDFSEYIEHMNNGILLDKDNPNPQLEKYLTEIYNGVLDIRELGSHLYSTIMNRFSISGILKEYDKIHASTQS